MEAIETNRAANRIRQSFAIFFGSWRNQAILYLGVLAMVTGGALVAEIRFQVPRPTVVGVAIASTVVLLVILPVLSVITARLADRFVMPLLAPISMYSHELEATRHYEHDRAELERALDMIKRQTAALLEAEHEQHRVFHIARHPKNQVPYIVPYPPWAEGAMHQPQFPEEVLEIIDAQRKALADSCGFDEAQRLFYAAALAHITTQAFEEYLRSIEEEHPDDNVVAAVENLRVAVRTHTD